jgi:hypothetical protein
MLRDTLSDQSAQNDRLRYVKHVPPVGYALEAAEKLD